MLHLKPGKSSKTVALGPAGINLGFKHDCIAVENNRQALGNWQSILFFETDDPKTRNIVIWMYH